MWYTRAVTTALLALLSFLSLLVVPLPTPSSHHSIVSLLLRLTLPIIQASGMPEMSSLAATNRSALRHKSPPLPQHGPLSELPCPALFHLTHSSQPCLLPPPLSPTLWSCTCRLAGCLRSLAVMAERVEEEELRGVAAPLADRLMARREGTSPGELALALWALAR